MTLIHYRNPKAFQHNGHSGLMTFDRLMDEFFSTLENADKRTSRPSANIFETNTEYRIELAVPGFDRKHLKLKLDNDLLKVYADNADVKNEIKDYSRYEFDYSNFERSFIIPETVDSGNISAEYNDGILKIHLPKKEDHIKRGPKEININ